MGTAGDGFQRTASRIKAAITAQIAASSSTLPPRDLLPSSRPLSFSSHTSCLRRDRLGSSGTGRAGGASTLETAAATATPPPVWVPPSVALAAAAVVARLFAALPAPAKGRAAGVQSGHSPKAIDNAPIKSPQETNRSLGSFARARPNTLPTVGLSVGFSCSIGFGSCRQI